MSDGTEQNATVPVVVGAGGGEAFGLSGFVIPANLTVGDSVYITGYGNITIAGETTGTSAGASRTVVYASFSQYGTQLTYYWDKQTGVMVEATVVSGTMTGTAKATETNIWQPELFGLDPILLYSLIMVIIVVVVAVMFFAVRRKKKSPEEAKSPRI
jgi:preprotein translocase subunit YajC